MNTIADKEFKNFHRLLCERFGYCHDERDWKRDQISLIEHIAKQRIAQSVALPERMQVPAKGYRGDEEARAWDNGWNACLDEILKTHTPPWRLIETAPNGEALVWFPKWGHLVAEFFDGVWRDDEGNTLTDEDNRGMPTHWMPLPIAPASSGEVT